MADPSGRARASMGGAVEPPETASEARPRRCTASRNRRAIDRAARPLASSSTRTDNPATPLIMPHHAPTRVFPADRVPAAGTPRSRHLCRIRSRTPALRSALPTSSAPTASSGGSMSDLTPAAQSWLADHHGVITAAALRDAAVVAPRSVVSSTPARSGGRPRASTSSPAHLVPWSSARGAVRGAPRRIRHGTDCRPARPPPADAAQLGVALRRAARCPSSRAARCPLPADHGAVDDRPPAAQRWHRRRVRGLAWPSISPPISGPSTTSRYLLPRCRRRPQGRYPRLLRTRRHPLPGAAAGR